jgi:ferrochelatase
MTKSVMERAVLLVGHGTIEHSSDVPEFLRRIRRGRPAPEEFMSEIRRRYDHIGSSPLLRTTEALARALEARLGARVRVAMRYWDPLIPDVVADVCEAGAEKVYVVPVAPFSVHVYAAAVEEALSQRLTNQQKSATLRAVAPYGDHPMLVAAHVDAIRPLIAGKRVDQTTLVLTAHSLPTRVIAMGDPYQVEFEKSARSIGDALGFPITIAYQSQGEGGGEWVGPTLLSAMESAKTAGAMSVVVAPVGFLADHVETLYDLDVEAAGQATTLGLEFHRVPALGTSPGLVETLATITRDLF